MATTKWWHSSYSCRLSPLACAPPHGCTPRGRFRRLSANFRCDSRHRPSYLFMLSCFSNPGSFFYALCFPVRFPPINLILSQSTTWFCSVIKLCPICVAPFLMPFCYFFYVFSAAVFSDANSKVITWYGVCSLVVPTCLLVLPMSSWCCCGATPKN